ncbi:MAG: hypothetical protein KAX66_09055 [Propionivibrio sp.]|nr:hypothetical protein [Propionivibrio sp.]
MQTLAAVSFDLETLPDDEDNLGENWRDLIAPHLGNPLMPQWTLGEYRESYGRPVRMLRKLAGLSEEQGAEVVGLSLDAYRAIEGRGVGHANFFETSRCITVLTLFASRRLDSVYVTQAWSSVAGEFDWAPTIEQEVKHYFTEYGRDYGSDNSGLFV